MQNIDRARILSINFSMFTGADVIIREGLADAFNLLEALPEIDLIISQDKIDDDDISHKIYQWKFEKDHNIPQIVIGLRSKIEGCKHILPEKVQLREVVTLTAKILGITAKSMSEKNFPNYYPIDIHYFLKIESSPCDVFVKIEKKDTEDQFVKVIHQGGNFEQEALDAYEDKNAKYLFVESQFRLEFTKFLSKRFVEILEDDSLTYGRKNKVD
jgi:hypothetical protein